MPLCDLSGLKGCLSRTERKFSKRKLSRVTSKVSRENGMSRVRIVMNEWAPKSVLIGVSMRFRELDIFNVFKQGFALIGLFRKDSEVRVKRFFLRVKEKSNRERARAPLLLMM